MSIIKLNERIEVIETLNELVISDGGKKTSIRVENQLMQMLLLLCKHEGNLVEKKLFVDEIWAGNHLVGDKALTKNIFKLRELLRANHIDSELQIETVPRKGYKLCINKENTTSSKKKAIYAKGVLMALSVFTAIVLYLYFNDQPKKKSLQVIPINGTSKDSFIFLDNEELKTFDPDTLTDKVIILEE